MSDQLLNAYQQRLLAAHEQKRAGNKVIGYISTAVPSELISASGMFPLLITGDVNRATSLADEWMEPQFDPMVRSIFDMALSGELEFLDLLIIPRVADSFMRLYLYLREVERLGLCKRLPTMMQFDLLQSQFRTSEEYNLARFAELRDTLKKLCGRAITSEAMHAAIEIANENRKALRELLLLRNEGTIDGATVLRAIGTRYVLPLDEHTTLVRQLIANAAKASASTDARIVVAGNAQDNAYLYEYLETQKLHIVGDYHWLGDNCCTYDIFNLREDPMQNQNDPLVFLAEHYQKYSLTSRRFPQSPQELVMLAQKRQAQGVVFFLFAAEEALSWDVPGQARALEAAGIPTLILDDQPYALAINDALDKKVAAFRDRVQKLETA